MQRLAIDGGPPVRSTPLPSWPVLPEEAIEAAAHVLRSGRINYWTGTECRTFETEYAAHVGTRHAVAVANGTVTIEMILRACGIGPGDEVITTPRTFVGTATAIVAVGARPVFADVDLDSGALCPRSAAQKITPRTRALLPVHLGGWPADLDALRDLADAHHLRLIEDCAQSHGATWRGNVTGSIGHAASFSFCQDKILTTGGEGGMITTDDEEIRRRCWEYKDHGKSWDAVYERSHPPGFRWLIESWGTNLRMTEMQGAIGRVILRHLPEWVERRRAIATRLIEGLSDLEGLRVPVPPAHAVSSWYRFYAYVRPERLRSGWSRDQIVAAIQAEGIPCFTGSCSEIYLERVFDASLRPAVRLEGARELGETSLQLLVHPTLSDDDCDDVVEAVRRVLWAATA
jgi:dTDP-4-amino-4,6-dideoxygalactose transaminase